MTDELSRRSVVRGLGLAVAGGVVGFVAARRSDAAKARPATSAANAYGAAPSGSGTALTTLDKVPTGGGLVVGSVVLTRDAQGDVRGYSATCTHQGCKVDTISNGRISCPCHGSAFDAKTGAVVQGPATRPLTPVPVEVRDGSVYAS